jgi:hypothetical protein
MTDKVNVRLCQCCLRNKDLNQFWQYKENGKTYLKNHCIECQDKERCHTCKKIKDRNRFIIRRKLIDTEKCKDCWNVEAKKVLRESLWI